jgi:hypothetical protein
VVELPVLPEGQAHELIVLDEVALLLVDFGHFLVNFALANLLAFVLV